VLAGTSEGVLMVESEAQELSEEIMLGAVTFGHQDFQQVIEASIQLAEHAAKESWPLAEPSDEEKALKARVDALARASIAEAYQETGDPAWQDSKWYEGNTITYGIGQSYLLVTPLQDLEWTATVANGGNYVRPQLTNRVTTVDGSMVRPFSAQVDHRVQASPEVLSIVREGLRAAAQTGGTSGFIWNQAQFKNVPSPSGKTGTAQYGVADSSGNYPLHAWYVAYAPTVDPEVAVVTFVEGGGEGHEASAPVAAQILSYYFAYRDQIRATGNTPAVALDAAPAGGN